MLFFPIVVLLFLPRGPGHVGSSPSARIFKRGLAEEGLQAAESNSRLDGSPAYHPAASSPKRPLSFISFLSPEPDLADSKDFHQGYADGTNLHQSRTVPSSSETRGLELNLLDQINSSNAPLPAGFFLDFRTAESDGRSWHIPSGSTSSTRPFDRDCRFHKVLSLPSSLQAKERTTDAIGRTKNSLDTALTLGRQYSIAPSKPHDVPELSHLAKKNNCRSAPEAFHIHETPSRKKQKWTGCLDLQEFSEDHRASKDLQELSNFARKSNSSRTSESFDTYKEIASREGRKGPASINMQKFPGKHVVPKVSQTAGGNTTPGTTTARASVFCRKNFESPLESTNLDEARNLGESFLLKTPSEVIDENTDFT